MLVLVFQSVAVHAIDNSFEILYEDKNSDYGSSTVESSTEKHLDTRIIEPVAPTCETEGTIFEKTENNKQKEGSMLSPRSPDDTYYSPKFEGKQTLIKESTKRRGSNRFLVRM